MLHRFRFVSAYVLAAVLIYTVEISYCNKRVYYFSVDRPQVTYRNPEYLSDIRFKARRMSRSDPLHYVNLTFILKQPATDDMMHSFYFYQLLTNVYKRSFVEFHFSTCDLIHTENLFGTSILSGYYNVPAAERQYPLLECPVKPGYYRLKKMKIPTKYIPENFPFDEGRIFYNVTKGNKQICNGHIDFVLLTEKEK